MRYFLIKTISKTNKFYCVSYLFSKIVLVSTTFVDDDILIIDDSLNESIETLRGDDKAGKTATRKGRTQKKVSKDDNSEDHTSGETTEVLRSSKLMKRPQMKMEKMVKVEAHQKQDSNTSM